ncbi:hypothetical protein AB0M22_09385 [Nocardia sp. NPDC051756]|uniref:hypothetical protein n=1 Tax=Nocardia sp. NPDC051756 TaxID=3154751 RepID=UPI0034399186
MTDLILERRDQPALNAGNAAVHITPPIDENYWAYRVRLGEHQAIVGFRKFWTLGIGFAVEQDWNRNLPFSADTDDILRHILFNKGDASISDDDVRAAIVLVQDAIRADLGEVQS